MKEVLLWLVRWACRAGKRDISSALAALVGTVAEAYTTQPDSKASSRVLYMYFSCMAG